MLDELIAAVAGGCGFRAFDYTATWDGGRYDPPRTRHELVIQTNDGRRVAIQLSQEMLGNPWRPLRPIEEAFQQLQRRAKPRGA